MSGLDSAIRARLDGRANGYLGHRAVVEVATAVLDLHQPVHWDTPHCRHDGYAWPCDTVRAIARGLGVPEGDGHE